jgi:hypothetical protein
MIFGDRMKKGQLFTMDFMVAVAMLTAGIGFTLQLNELVHRNASLQAELVSNNADVIAEAFALNRTLSAPVNFCRYYGNGTTDCTSFSCAKNIFSARRLVPCIGSSVCLLEVRTCE